MEIEKLSEDEKIQLINEQISRFIKLSGIYNDIADNCRAIGLTEGWIQMHNNLPKNYSAKEIYNAISRGFYKFMQNETNSMKLSKKKAKEIKENNLIDRLYATDTLKRTEWGHLDVLIQNPYHTIGQQKNVLKRVLGALKAKDRKVFIIMYRDVIKDIDRGVKRKTYDEVGSLMGLTSRTILTAHSRIVDAISKEFNINKGE